MIAEIARDRGEADDVEVTLAIPGGDALADRTTNARLGIVGGLSILGTTGVVIPDSCASWCNDDVHTSAFDGVLADVDVQELRSLFPASAGNFDGREPGTGAQTSNGRPNTEPYGFTVKVVAQLDQGGIDLQGEDRRNMYLHRDQDMLPGFPRDLGGAHGDGESSPIFVDLDGDNRNELVVGGSDGFVHAYRPDGSELAGWPVRGDIPPLHTGGRAFQSGAVSDNVGGAILSSVAAADMDRDGAPEVVGADMEGKVYAWDDRGNLLFRRGSNPDFSGKPLQPFEDVRYVRSNPDESKRRRRSTGSSAPPCWSISTATTAGGSRSWPRRWTAMFTRGMTTARPCRDSRAGRGPHQGGLRGLPDPRRHVQLERRRVAEPGGDHRHAGGR